MKRKLSVIVTALTSIVSISLVALLGIRASDPPQTIRVERLAFINEEGEEITRKRVNYTSGVETMEVKYKVFPENATNQEVFVLFDDYGEDSGVECLPSLTHPGVIDIDFKGQLLETFLITIISADTTSVEAKLRYVAVNE